jgi:dipeptidyl aminopeptidase/acylaminoacyl peptidase
VRGQQRLGNGVYVMTIAGGEQRMLDAMAADYDQLTWSEDGNHLAVLRGDKQRTQAQKDNIVLAWRNVGTAQQQKVTLDPTRTPGFPAGMVISEFSTIRFSKDGSRLLVGVKEQEAAKPAPPAGEAQANVDVWHWRDEQPQSVQVVQINQARRQTFASVIDLSSGTFKRIADDDMPTVTPTDDLQWAVGRLDKPYRGTVEWGASKADYYRINLTTGERMPIETSLSRALGLSADNKYFLYLKNGHVFSFDMASGKKAQIDGAHSFVNAEDDHDYEKPAYGVAGFTADGRSALLYDRYDVWALPLAGGTPVNVTKGAGAKDEVRYRIVSLAPGGRGGGRGGGGGGGRGGGAGRETIDLTKPLTLSAYGQWTKKTGYFNLEPGAQPAPMIWLDKSVGTPTVARDADRMMFTEQTFREYPNYWVSDRKFTSPRQVTDADPALLKEFAWGSKMLVDYKNSKGQRLQATLTLPANYQPGRKYPMLVYFYELMSDTHHTFQLPPYDDRPHMATYASNGYLVLQPDVVYEIGKPGTSALDCVTSAVREVIKQGYADPAHIGLQGHSWGGYESSFILTQTDMFAAIVTGAPPTDLTSFYDTLYRSSGTIQQGITEVGQVRMGAGMTPWSNHVQWESQSPIHSAPNIKTPFMILQGTADGSVDAGQGLELYAAARRLGKQVILLSYPDEGHHLGRRENQKDFLLRMQQFFDHYLKDTPMPDWMANGLPQLRKGEDPKLMPKPVNGANGGGRGGN